MDYQGIEIKLERRRAVFARCAAMMAKSDPWITLGFDEAACAAAFDGKGKDVFVIKKNGQLAGFVILQMLGTFRGYIQTLMVAEEFRGQGLSRVLLITAELHSARISRWLFICVSTFNEHAKEIYTQYGFEPVGVLKDFVRDGFDELLMRKKIAVNQSRVAGDDGTTASIGK